MFPNDIINYYNAKYLVRPEQLLEEWYPMDGKNSCKRDWGEQL